MDNGAASCTPKTQGHWICPEFHTVHFIALTKVASSWSLVSVVNTVFHSSNQQKVLECQSHEECDPRAPEGEQIQPSCPEGIDNEARSKAAILCFQST